MRCAGQNFKTGQSQGSNCLGSKRPVSAHTADSNGSDAFKRARTVSSALLDLLPLASDASTFEPRWKTPLNSASHVMLRMCKAGVAAVRHGMGSALPIRSGGRVIGTGTTGLGEMA